MWGTELWDQYDGVCSHLDGRLDQVKRISAFVKDRIKIEQDYAKELRKLNKSYSKMKQEETKFASTDSFAKVVAHCEELAQHHDTYSNKLQSDVYDALKKLGADQNKEKKSIMTDASKQQSTYQSALASNEKMKKKYENAQQDADKAHAAYLKADADMALSRAAVEKIRKTSDQKQFEAEDTKKSFQTSIDDTNKVQREHFTSKMPIIFKQLQQLDETRTTEMIKSLVQYIGLESEVLPGWEEAQRKVKDQCASVKPEKDTAQLIDDLATGLPIPCDMTMDDLIAPPPPEKEKRSKKNSAQLTTGQTSMDLFESLPPTKRKKKLTSKLSDLKSSSKKEEAELRALEKMTQVYTANPSLGDPGVVQQKIQPLVTRCDAINDEMYRVECALATLENRDMPAPPISVASHTTPTPSTSSDPSSASAEPTNEDHEDNHPGGVKKSGSTTWSDDFQDNQNQRCTVLYDFTASSQGELSVACGETLELLQDDGSGWISVKRGSDQGYIPLSYVQMA